MICDSSYNHQLVVAITIIIIGIMTTITSTTNIATPPPPSPAVPVNPNAAAPNAHLLQFPIHLVLLTCMTQH
jgi:hypothetical protein